MMTKTEVLKRLRALIRERGTQTEAAKALGVSSSYLSEVLSGRREVGPLLLNSLNLERKTVYADKQS